MLPDRCTGHCCRSFWTAHTPEEIREQHARWLAGDWPHEGDVAEIDILGPMLIPLGGENPGREVTIENDQFCYTDAPEDERPGFWYTCRYLRPNGDCGIYEIRPRMCSSYPDQKPCRYAGCTWVAARGWGQPAAA